MFKFLLILNISFFSAYTKIYRMEDLINLAIQNNLQTRIEEAKLSEIKTKINREKSSYFPQLKGVIGTERRDSRSEPEINKNNFLAELRLDYDIYRFGETKNKIKSLETLYQFQDKFKKIKELEIKRLIKKEYYQYIYLREKLNLLKEEVIYNQDLRKKVTRKQKQGLVGKADGLEIEMREASLKLKILRFSEELKHTEDHIRRICYIDHDDAFQIQGQLPYEHFSFNFDDLTKAAKNSNSDSQRISARIEALNQKLAASKSKSLPNLRLAASYGLMRLDEQETDNSLEGHIGLFLVIPIFDGGYNKSYRDEVKAQLVVKRLERNNFYNKLDIDLHHGYEALLNLQKQVDLAQLNIKHCKNYFNNVMQEYRRGIKNSLDLVSARDRLLNFRLDLLSAKKGYQLAKVKLEEVSGVSF